VERLNKILARAGIASRRGADRLIEEGRVRVNGAIVRELGTRIDPDKDAVKVDGKRIPPLPTRHTYLILNKPRGYVTTLSDPEGRPTVSEFLRGIRGRLYPVGRLDFHSEGLLLLTDDGDLARDLMHPGSHVPKTYAVKVRGTPTREALARLRAGVVLEDGKTKPARVRRTKPGANAWLEITIGEGRKHQIRRMLQAVGHPVLKLRRVGYGGLGLSGLPPGGVRPLSSDEVERLRGATGRGGRSRTRS
jgi:23S rRNA pseudouridine2605 synthase/16S rRNA pseudouridine516 synthase